MSIGNGISHNEYFTMLINEISLKEEAVRSQREEIIPNLQTTDDTITTSSSSSSNDFPTIVLDEENEKYKNAFKILEEKSGFLHSRCFHKCESSNPEDQCLSGKTSRLYYNVNCPEKTHISTLAGFEKIKLNANLIKLQNPDIIAIAMQYPSTKKDHNELLTVTNILKNPLIFDLTNQTDLESKKELKCYYPINSQDSIANEINQLTLKVLCADRVYDLIEYYNPTIEGSQYTRLHVKFWEDRTGMCAFDLNWLTDLAIIHLLENRALIVHCAAGVGRTGTFFAAIKIKQKIIALEENLCFEDLLQLVEEIALEIRKARGSGCINREQYSSLIHFAVYVYNKKHGFNT